MTPTGPHVADKKPKVKRVKLANVFFVGQLISEKVNNKTSEQGESSQYSLFTLAKHDGRLTLRHMKFKAANSDEYD